MERREQMMLGARLECNRQDCDFGMDITISEDWIIDQASYHKVEGELAEALKKHHLSTRQKEGRSYGGHSSFSVEIFGQEDSCGTIDGHLNIWLFEPVHHKEVAAEIREKNLSKI